jgi:hypothetical protein
MVSREPTRVCGVQAPFDLLFFSLQRQTDICHAAATDFALDPVAGEVDHGSGDAAG